MRMLRRSLLLLALAGAPALAQAPATDERAVDAVALALELAEVGRATSSALPLLASAELLLTHGPRALAEGSAPGADVMAMLADAERYAANAEMRALATALRRRAAAGARGSASGPRAASYAVAARASHVVPIAFVAGSPAAVRVRAGAGRRVECEVRDASDEVLAADRGSSSCFLNFTPASSAPVRIVVRNVGAAPASIVVVTN